MILQFLSWQILNNLRNVKKYLLFEGLRYVLDPSVIPFQVPVQTLSQHPSPVLSTHPMVSDGDTSVRDNFSTIVHGYAHIHLSRTLA
jgi:hypothetical protein